MNNRVLSGGNIRGNGRTGAIVAGIMPRYAHRKRALRPGAIGGEHNRGGAVGFYQCRRHARIVIGVVNRIHQLAGVDKTVTVTVLICRRQIDIHSAVAHRQFKSTGSGKGVVAHTERGLLPLRQLLNEKRVASRLRLGIGGNGRRVIIAGGGKSHRAVGIAVQRVNGALEIAQRRAERVQAAAFSIQLTLLLLQIRRLSSDIRIRDFLRNGSWVDH